MNKETKTTRFLVAVLAIAITGGALLIVEGGCGPQKPDGLQGAVLILLDTVRADHLPCYGYGRDTAPTLSRLADEGVLFEQTVAYSSWTLPSVLNILSACQPDQRVFDKRLTQSVIESIAAAGYTTSAVTEGGYVSRHFGMDLGFTDYYEEEGAVQLRVGGKPIGDGPSGGIESTFEHAREWLAANREEKFFLFIHTYEPHIPYTRRTYTEGMKPGRVGEIFPMELPPQLQRGKIVLDASEHEYVKALYDGGIRESDRHVGEFLDYLEEMGLEESTLVVVTSDHGEELGDHYPAFTGDHGHSLYDELLLVPLIIRHPTRDFPARRIEQQVRLMDVLPTIADYLEAPLLREVQGQSLRPLMEGEDETERVAFGRTGKVGTNRFFLRFNDYKMIRVVAPPTVKDPPLRPEPPPVRLFDLAADPRENASITSARPELLRQMLEIMDHFKPDESGQGNLLDMDDLDENARKRLKSLGYLR